MLFVLQDPSCQIAKMACERGEEEPKAAEEDGEATIKPAVALDPARGLL